MTTRCLIGDDLQEAIDWLQDLMLTTRPKAENGMIAMLREGAAITTDEGIILIEDEEELKKKFSNRTERKKSNHKFSRHNYKHNSGLKSSNISKSIKKASVAYSDAANDMIEHQTNTRCVGHDSVDEEN